MKSAIHPVRWILLSGELNSARCVFTGNALNQGQGQINAG